MVSRVTKEAQGLLGAPDSSPVSQQEASHSVIPINILPPPHEAPWRPQPYPYNKTFFRTLFLPQLCRRLWENFPKSFCNVRAMLATGLCGCNMGNPSLGNWVLRYAAWFYQSSPRRLNVCSMTIYSNRSAPNLTRFLCLQSSKCFTAVSYLV